ncbi:MAG: hypothetical protein IJ260_04380 [Butyrivibrio sp.]|nr:hypothetical protein [Butyrivibrio sp.]MBR1543127.1 hypothetical protein [Bacteroidaceae bacterium]
MFQKTVTTLALALCCIFAFAQDKHQGPISPEDALELMKTTDNLVILDVREPQYIGNSNYFKGSIRIPWTEMSKRYREVPEGRPVLINCGLGQVAPRAYETLKNKRPDIQILYYIAGAPLFNEYNQWKSRQMK